MYTSHITIVSIKFCFRIKLKLFIWWMVKLWLSYSNVKQYEQNIYLIKHVIFFEQKKWQQNQLTSFGQYLLLGIARVSWTATYESQFYFHGQHWINFRKIQEFLISSFLCFRSVLRITLYFQGLQYSSPIFASATNNIIPSITFTLVVVFRYIPGQYLCYYHIFTVLKFKGLQKFYLVDIGWRNWTSLSLVLRQR